MTRDDIYDHLAQVYLGKRRETEKKNKKELNAWLVINILITLTIFASSVYGLSAFLTHRKNFLQQNIIFSLHNGPIRVEYNFTDAFPPTKNFLLTVPEVMDSEKFNSLKFSVRGKEEGIPDVLKVVLTNERNEISSYYIKGLDLKWQDYEIPLEEFKEITDWSTLKDVSFVLESWNVGKKRGLVLIDNVCFSI